MTIMQDRERVAEHITVTGIVQGVGFRPFVFRLANELGLNGSVGNDSAHVLIDVEGPRTALECFAERLIGDAPPLSMIESVERTRRRPVEAKSFTIAGSMTSYGERTLVSPDTAACADCLAELRDPNDRRYGHPFITCTNCGPRFTIIAELPYDRPNTTLASFEMCARCTTEYRDPADRRYHAQPISCHDCGPTVSYLTNAGSRTHGAAAIERTVRAIESHQTVAIKGLGGFHLACDATSDAAVTMLRDRKHRPDQPFAVMVAALDQVGELAHVTAFESELLRSPACPIVLLRARESTSLSARVAPENRLIGVMLPSTPLHHLVLDAVARPLVMTSGNRSGEPIAFHDADAAERLGPLCDAVLTHDRPILLPCDDSVVRVVRNRLLPIRRARGYAPIPVSFPHAIRRVLAVGGELKNTFCVSSTEHAWVSQHIGDMANLETLDAFDRAVDQFTSMYAVRPELVAVDAHPGYSSSNWARRTFPDQVVEIQHHHAHVASLMAEHRLDPATQVVGIAFDGTGYGDDGAIWGGEVLVADATGFDRVAHLENVRLPGGDAAVEHPSRSALAHLHAAGIEWTADLAPVTGYSDNELRLFHRQIDRNIACVPTSSMGRLFDAVASLLALRQRVSFEAQAALDLEMAAGRGNELTPYRFELDGTIIRVVPVVRRIVDDLRDGHRPADIALTFHLAISELVVDVAERTRDRDGLSTVALTGGVFQNALLTTMCLDRLEDRNFRVLTHRLVPPNDGGLALGQAFIAAHLPDSAAHTKRQR